MDLSHNSRPLVCLPRAKIIAVSKERARAAAVSGWFIVSVDGYLLRLHHKGCKIECSCERFPLPPYCVVFFLWSVLAARRPSSCAWVAVVSSGSATGATGSLLLAKVNQVNWLLCGRGAARVDACSALIPQAAFCPPAFPRMFAVMTCSCPLGVCPRPDSHSCTIWGLKECFFLMAA